MVQQRDRSRDLDLSETVSDRSDQSHLGSHPPRISGYDDLHVPFQGTWYQLRRGRDLVRRGRGGGPAYETRLCCLLTSSFLVRLAGEIILGTACPTFPNLKNFNPIYASGMFCEAGSSGSRDDQYRPISFTRGTLGELVIQGSSRSISLPYSALEGALKHPPIHPLRPLMLHRTDRS